MSKKIYPSKYTDNKITAHQYLADEIVERIARKEGKILPYKYWYSNEWAKIYKRQVTAAGQLLQEANCLDIMNFLRSPKGRFIYSLGLRKQILEGIKAATKIKGIEVTDIIIDDFVEDIPEEEILPSEAKPSLWEKLS